MSGKYTTTLIYQHHNPLGLSYKKTSREEKESHHATTTTTTTTINLKGNITLSAPIQRREREREKNLPPKRKNHGFLLFLLLLPPPRTPPAPCNLPPPLPPLHPPPFTRHPGEIPLRSLLRLVSAHNGRMHFRFP